MESKIVKQDILTLNNKKYYILDLNCDLYTVPNYSSKQVQIEIFDYSWVHERKFDTNGNRIMTFVISIANEKEYQFEGKNIYFIPENKIEELNQKVKKE